MLDLPANVLACIFLQWLDVKSLTKYDMALCEHVGRISYLDALKSPRFALQEVRNSVIWTALSLNGYQIDPCES
jgi:hypothetical protein